MQEFPTYSFYFYILFINLWKNLKNMRCNSEFLSEIQGRTIRCNQETNYKI